MIEKKAFLLINIGSPESYKVGAVRKYLRQFLSDKRVINVPAFFRHLLVNGIIVPFRAPKSAKKYKEIWTDLGSPLITNSVELRQKLSKLTSHDVYLAMRYGNPSLKNILKEIKEKKYSELVVCPLFPHNASSTTSSAIEEVFRLIKNWENYPSIKVISEFWNHPLYAESLARKVQENNPADFDHIVISFHGLPLSQVYKAHKGKTCAEMRCTESHNVENRYCYQAVCYETALQLAQNLNLLPNTYSISFQSRLSNNWLQPFTDKVLIDLVHKGKKKIMVICPSFISDCLETIHEIGIEYEEIFKKNGGEKIFLVPSLNSYDYWADSFLKILES
ncbi:MAG: ferrochelatase [Salinivirgaceae bacterium]|jgi:ferrochelatase|nr:ferrochelatase [Salinivirgaceae bacterium]